MSCMYVRLLGVCMAGFWVYVCQALGCVYVRLLGVRMSGYCMYVWQVLGCMYVRILGVCVLGSWVYVCQALGCMYVWSLHVLGALVNVKLMRVCYVWMYMCSSGSPNCLETRELKVH
uniref:Uncharacterized protein n=1 Tax=Cacopsylla melanoneura TaxID=428564 RepID=A0A8D8Z868_9HEMI